MGILKANESSRAADVADVTPSRWTASQLLFIRQLSSSSSSGDRPPLEIRTMAAVSMHGSENAFGGMNSGMNRRLSPAFRTLASPLRQRHFDLEKLRELARSDEFSDSESDGVDSDEDEDDDVADTMFVPYRRPSPKRKIVVAQRRAQRQQKKKDDKAGSSPKGDEWEIVDKSPTFESVVDGKTELGGESWFVQDRE